MKSIEGKVRKALFDHFSGREFTAKDLAAWVGCSDNCAGKWLMDIRGVKFVGERVAPQARGKPGSLKPAKIYTFSPVKEEKW